MSADGHELTVEQPGLERIGFATALLALAATITLVSIAGIVGRLVSGHPWSPPTFAALAIAGALAIGALARRARGPLPALAAQLPDALDGSFARQRRRAVLVVVLLCISVLQMARLSCFMADDTLRWGSAFPPTEEGVKHMCQASYVQAADLIRQGVGNVYEEKHYPAFSDAGLGQAPPTESPVAGLGRYIEDAYEYPPPFLVLPRAALALSNDYMIHRTGWFMIQALALLAFALALCRRIGGGAGLVALLLLPAALASLPGMFSLQFGQWHTPAILLALGGMLAFSSQRDALGGALLAAAVVTKVFPGLLLLLLLSRKRWRALAWTGAFSVLWCAVGLVVVGMDSYVAFATYQLPRIASGEAFSFFLKSDLVIASNYAVYGIPIKLQKLGVPGVSHAMASGLTTLYGIALLAITVIVGRRRVPIAEQPALWLGLLVLASLRSPLAPSVYVAAPALWLHTLVAWQLSRRRGGITIVVLGFITMGGLPPMPSPNATIALWMLGQVAMLLLGFWVVLRAPNEQAS